MIRRRPAAARATTRATALAVVLVLLGACGGGDGGGGVAGPAGPPSSAAGDGTTIAGSSTTSIPAADPDLDKVAVTLRQVAPLQRPTAMAVRPGDDAVYVAEKGGRVVRIADGQRAGATVSGAAPVVLDVSGEVSNGSEQGLLGLTFSPDGTKLYIDYTDRRGDTRVVEYAFAAERANAATKRELLFVDQPFANHNGGQVVFGPDGKLYIGLGDGGSQRDPRNNGQSLGTLLGKILRIDPTPSGDRPYTVPPDNPFVGRPGARPEIFAFGLRNPWRFSWDRRTRDLWIADVGQDSWEEVDYLPAARTSGANLGWSLMDSRHELKGTNPEGGILPIYEYDHDDGSCSVTGGYVYRGNAIPDLQGAYVFADYCSGVVRALVQQDGKVADDRTIDVGGRMLIQSFGEDAGGELYVLSTTAIFRFEKR